MEKKKKWIRPRHRVIRNIAVPLLKLWARGWLGADVKPFTEQGDRNWLILANHQTPYDQFFAGVSSKQPVCFLTSEDLFSKGWISDIIRWGTAPIPIVKNTTDLKALRN